MNHPLGVCVYSNKGSQLVDYTIPLSSSCASMGTLYVTIQNAAVIFKSNCKSILPYNICFALNELRAELLSRRHYQTRGEKRKSVGGNDDHHIFEYQWNIKDTNFEKAPSLMVYIPNSFCPWPTMHRLLTLFAARAPGRQAIPKCRTFCSLPSEIVLIHLPFLPLP